MDKKLKANFKMRKCMNPKCGKSFLSQGPHNRLCENCRRISVPNTPNLLRNV